MFSHIFGSHADPFRVMVPANHLVAVRGHHVILGCEFSPDLGPHYNLSNLVVTWQRQEDNDVVHSYYYEKDQLEHQSPRYRGRTALFVNKLARGNASLHLEQVALSDEGRYLCTVSTDMGTEKAELRLDYGAFYNDLRLSINVKSPDILVQYEAKGFPAPEVMWIGEHGENISNHTQTSLQIDQEDGLYLFKSSYVAPSNPLNFTFVLQNKLLHQHLEMPVSYSYEVC
ncbi:V-set domain-containing T-cell activation inhibitor 1 [Trichomycterus rosablanca]|uniref:V-set domain-containing T-cell activation inhibitor 1 n=1 Tax=Trichomycterus rosablanca TaxID=2290929 RepID=UPI002F35883D